MREAEGARPGAVRLDQLLALERLEVAIELAWIAGAIELAHGSSCKRSSDHGGRVDDGALCRVEPIEPRGQHRVDGRRHADRGRLRGPRQARLARVSCRSSTSIRTSSSTKRGFPSAAPKTRPGTSAATPASPTRCSTSLRLSAPLKGGSSTLAAAPTSRAKSGLTSKSSVRATTTIRIGDAPDGRPRGARSGRGRSGSAQWTSSKTTTSGRACGDALQQLADGPEGLPAGKRRRRQARCAPATRSTTEAASASAESRRAILAMTASALSPTSLPASSSMTSTQRPEGEARSIGQAPTAHDAGLALERARELLRPAGTSRLRRSRPGSPSRSARSARARSSAARSSASSGSRPTRGESSRRVDGLGMRPRRGPGGMPAAAGLPLDLERRHGLDLDRDRARARRCARRSGSRRAARPARAGRRR